MRLADGLALVEQSSAKELASITRDEFMFIVAGMAPEEIQTFMFSKNIKIFGGINKYVDDFFRKGTVAAAAAMPLEQRIGILSVLQKMSEYEGINKKNKERVAKAIQTLNPQPAAPAARLSKTRKQRGGNKQVVHCISQLKRFAPCIQTNPLRAYQFFYNLGRVQELVGDTEHPEIWWKPIEGMVEKGEHDAISAHVDTLRDRLGIEYDQQTVAKGC